MAAISLSITRGKDGFAISDFTVGTLTPNAGDVELRFNTTDANSATMLMIDALEKANKDFDLVVFPGRPHSYGDVAGAYMMRRRWDYFIANLMKATPPHEFPMPPLLLKK